MRLPDELVVVVVALSREAADEGCAQDEARDLAPQPLEQRDGRLGAWARKTRECDPKRVTRQSGGAVGAVAPGRRMRCRVGAARCWSGMSMYLTTFGLVAISATRSSEK